MAILRRSEVLNLYNKQQSHLLDEAGEKRYASNKLTEHRKEYSAYASYDIFLSHSYDDARIIKQIRDMLVKKGYSVYVDWIEDDHLDRGKVTPSSAEVLRSRMNSCSSLLYVTSESAEKSVWMPWELGYMDAKTGRVAVAPVLDEDTDFNGREYLGLYPYLDLTSDSFYIHSNPSEWVGFKGWMAGERPAKHL